MRGECESPTAAICDPHASSCTSGMHGVATRGLRHVQWMLADALHFALHVALLSYRLALAT